MHEASLARQIVATVLEHALRERAARVLSVAGWVSETEPLSRESLALHFDLYARGTCAEGARLELRLEHVRARCFSCGKEYAPEHHLLVCPACGGAEADLLGRVGLGVDSIEVV
jgi:hydrogenase nickel incorporation protein HypA/HybF